MSSNASLKSALPRRGWGPALAPARRTAALRGGCAVLLVACSESEAEEAAAEGVHDEGIDSISLASGVASPSDARRDVGRGISTTGRAKWNVVVARSAPTPVRSQLSTVKTRRSLSQPHAVPRRLAALSATLGRRPPLRPEAPSAARCPSTPRRSPTRTRRPPTPSRGPPGGGMVEIARDHPEMSEVGRDQRGLLATAIQLRSCAIQLRPLCSWTTLRSLTRRQGWGGRRFTRLGSRKRAAQ